MSTLLAFSALLASSTLAAHPTAPAPGFVQVEVMEVVPTDDGFAVLLLHKEADLVLPIFIGNAEGLAIKQRLEKQPSPRPMTHDLLEDVITELGAKLVRIEIDDLKANTFLGRLVLEHNKKQLTLDSRPSDSIAIALGLSAPILVSHSVLDRAGVPLKESAKKSKRSPRPETL